MDTLISNFSNSKMKILPLLYTLYIVHCTICMCLTFLSLFLFEQVIKKRKQLRMEVDVGLKYLSKKKYNYVVDILTKKYTTND